MGKLPISTHESAPSDGIPSDREAFPADSKTGPAAPGLDYIPPVRLSVLTVRIPQDERSRADLIWNHIQEDALGSDRRLALQDNGLRAGLGRKEWWDAIKTVLEGVSGRLVTEHPPFRIPPAYPLGLELDHAPREQNLWVIGADGVLSGESWPNSRNVLRVSYRLDRQHPERVVLEVVPEVRQRMPGWQWVQTDAGLWQVPKHDGRAFASAGFTMTLAPGDFVLVAPAGTGGVPGLIGNAFLSEETEGRRFDSFVFISPLIGDDGETD